LENEKVLLTMRQINKEFPGVKALSGVDFTLRRGEIHALLGENGAGKSTLIKVLTGVEHADGGEIKLDGRPISAKSPQHAQELGISTVYQEVNLCPNLSVAENIFIGREPMRRRAIDWKEINAKSRALMESLDIRIDVTRTLDNYSVAIQQMVAIARAIDTKAQILILDEPTSSLDKNESQKLFEVMRKLRGEGMGIIFVTHFLDQVYEVSDMITVLRNGLLVGEYETASLSMIDLVGKMIGRNYEDLEKSLHIGDKAPDGAGRAFFEAEGLYSAGNIEPFDIKAYKGEALGLAGLLGSGRTEMARAMFGADRIDGGRVKIDGGERHIKSVYDAIVNGIGYCPEDRKADGIIGNLTVRENIILALQSKRGMFRRISRKEQDQTADKYIDMLQIKTPGKEQYIKNLSGGNQQKVILARWLATDPELLILDEPTRGIDVGTKAEVQKIVVDLAQGGMAVIFISSEMEEVTRCCTRVLVLNDKKIIGELSGGGISQNEIMNMIAGGRGDEQ